jgi:hypothetical protein
VDLVEEVGEDAFGFFAPADGGEFAGDGAEVVQRAADLDEAVVQFVYGFGVLVGVFGVVEVFVDELVDDVVAGGGGGLVMGGQCSWCGECRGGVSMPRTARLTVVSTTARPGRSAVALS